MLFQVSPSPLTLSIISSLSSLLVSAHLFLHSYLSFVVLSIIGGVWNTVSTTLPELQAFAEAFKGSINKETEQQQQQQQNSIQQEGEKAGEERDNNNTNNNNNGVEKKKTKIKKEKINREEQDLLAVIEEDLLPPLIEVMLCQSTPIEY